MQHGRAVAVDHALGVPGGPGRVAHGSGGVLVLDGEGTGERRCGGEELLVIEDPGVVGNRSGGSVVDHDDVLDRVQLVGQRHEQRQQRAVDEDDLVLRVVDDVDQLVGEQPDVEGVQHASGARCGEVQLQVPPGVPAERAHPRVRTEAQVVQHRGQPAHAVGPVGDGGAAFLPDLCRDDLLVAEELFGPVEDVGEDEGAVLHQAEHLTPPVLPVSVGRRRR